MKYAASKLTVVIILQPALQQFESLPMITFVQYQMGIHRTIGFVRAVLALDFPTHSCWIIFLTCIAPWK